MPGGQPAPDAGVPPKAAGGQPASAGKQPPPQPQSPVSLRPAANGGAAIPPHGQGSALDARPIAQRSPRAALQPESVPPPRRHSRRVRNPIVIAGNALLTLIFLLTVGAGVAFVIGKQRFDQPGPLQEDKIVNIPRGGIRDTADLLTREGVIDQPNLFVAGALMAKAQNELKYGEYRFTRNASLRDVVDTIISGKVVQHALTIAEGLTSDQIVQRLMEIGRASCRERVWIPV